MLLVNYTKALERKPVETGSETMAQWVRCLLREHKDLSLDPWPPCKSWELQHVSLACWAGIGSSLEFSSQSVSLESSEKSCLQKQV